MKRDCGQGELIPVKWEVVSIFDQSDEETVSEHPTLQAALVEYNRQAEIVKTISCSNARLYAKDKQGYCNCVKSIMHCLNGKIEESDRLSELTA